MIAEGVAALSHHIQAIGQAAFFVQRATGIQDAALHALIVELAAQRDGGLRQWLLGDDVESTARVATAIEHRRRPAQHFEAFDGVGIRHVRIAAVDREAVAVELTGGEAANGKGGQPLATKIVGPSHAAGVIEGVLQSGGADVLDDVFRDHGDGLRRFMNRGVGAGRAGRTGR
ncbi:hypothetical protein D3C73_1082790 [compost metagenome]